MKTFDYTTYLSPFTWRYGSSQMREIWSDFHKRMLWRQIWVELAKTQHKLGLVSKAELDDIIVHKNDVDIEKAHEIEKEIYHDVMSEIKVFSSQCKVGGGKIHLGATSTDIVDNAEILQIKEALRIIEQLLIELLEHFEKQIDKYQHLVCMGYTHLQPAEPTTLGYRLSIYAQDLLWDLQQLRQVKKYIKGKGIKGAVGTSASYENLLKGKRTTASDQEKMIMDALEIEAVEISGQTYPRKIDWFVLVSLADIAQSLHKFNFDLRIMQSPNFGEWSEPRSAKRVGSSAMPFKKNPDKAEKVCSLARLISSYLPVAWSNSATLLLERTLDDSANRRVFLPDSFLATEECLRTTASLVKDLVIFDHVIESNVQKYGIFSCTESLMMALVKKGANRQDIHELVRELSMKAWEEIQNGNPNPLKNLLLENKTIIGYLTKKEIEQSLDIRTHIGNAPEKAKKMVQILRKELKRL